MSENRAGRRRWRAQGTESGRLTEVQSPSPGGTAPAIHLAVSFRIYPNLNGRIPLLGPMILRYQYSSLANMPTIRWRCQYESDESGARPTGAVGAAGCRSWPRIQERPTGC